MPPTLRETGQGHLVVISSIWDSMGMLESWGKDGSFFSLPFGLCLVLEAGRPVGQETSTFCDEAMALC